MMMEVISGCELASLQQCSQNIIKSHGSGYNAKISGQMALQKMIYNCLSDMEDSSADVIPGLNTTVPGSKGSDGKLMELS
jgi:hypothetical protein